LSGGDSFQSVLEDYPGLTLSDLSTALDLSGAVNPADGTILDEPVRR